MTTGAAPAFQPVQTLEQITRALNAAPGKPVMLDVYADWCVACKEFDKYTFSDPAVAEQMHRLTLLQADVTANAPAQKMLLSQLQVMGLPTILFFDSRGNEIPGSRVTGFMNAAERGGFCAAFAETGAVSDTQLGNCRLTRRKCATRTYTGPGAEPA